MPPVGNGWEPWMNYDELPAICDVHQAISSHFSESIWIEHELYHMWIEYRLDLLVGGLEHGFLMTFHSVGVMSSSQVTHIFSQG